MLALVLLLLVLVTMVTRTRRKRRPGEPPLVQGWIPFLGKALDFRRNNHRFLEDLRRTHGDVFTVLIAGRYMTFVLNPLHFPSVIKHGRQLDFHEFSDTVAPFAFGYSPLSDTRCPGLRDDVHAAYQLLQGPHLQPLAQSMMGNLLLVLREDVLSRAPTDVWTEASLYDFLFRVTFEATFMTIYGRAVTGRRHDDMDQLCLNFSLFDKDFPLLMAQVPLWLLGRTKAVRQKLISVFSPSHVAQWKSSSLFIQRRSAVFDQQEALSSHDKAAQHFAMLWASVGNTGPAMFWCVYFLLRHKEALQAVRQELQEVMSQKGVEFSVDSDVVLDRDLLDRLVILDSVVRETFRLSTMSMNVRVAQDDFTLTLDRPYALRCRDIIAMCPQSVHLDPEIYPDPETFRFDRFLGDGGGERTDFFKGGQRLKHFLLPFGSGATMCPGRHIAQQEIKQLVCLLLLYLDLDLDHREPPAEPDYNRAGLGIMQPLNDVRFRYRPQRRLQV